MLLTLSPEYRLLTQAASPISPDAASAAASAPVSRAAELDRPALSDSRRVLDWDLVLRQARHQRVTSLLSRHLDATGVVVPAAVAEELTIDRRRTAASNLRLLAAARTIVDALAGQGVTVVALKGLALLEGIYPDVSLRPMVDLDFLVREECIQRAEDIVLGLGYHSARPRRDGTVGPRAGKYAYPQLTSDDLLVHVDLHRHLLSDVEFDIDEVWTHAGPSPSGVHLVPDGEDLLLHVAAHFFKDRIRRSEGSLGQLADIAWTLHGRTVDWDVVVRRAYAYGLHGRVFLALMAANELVAPLVPEDALAELRPASYSPSAGRAFVSRRLLSDAPWPLPGYFTEVPPAAFSRRRRPLRRLFPDRVYLVNAFGRDVAPGMSYGRLLWMRARRAASRLRPRRLYGDARLNRWMRAVAAERGPEPRRS